MSDQLLAHAMAIPVQPEGLRGKRLIFGASTTTSHVHVHSVSTG